MEDGLLGIYKGWTLVKIKRLKDKLRRERELRELGGDGDMDMEALIEALQMGEDIYASQYTFPFLRKVFPSLNLPKLVFLFSFSIWTLENNSN